LKPAQLFHISENGSIKKFLPRPSPSHFDQINGNVVFAITERLLHNYLFPRDCPRVTYYATTKSSDADKEKFFNHPAVEFVIAVEAKWLPVIQQTTLYCYEFSAESFVLLDECAGYYISYESVEPASVRRISNVPDELFKRTNIELRVLPSLSELAGEIVQSSLNFSLIRMRNAEKNRSI